MPDWLDFMAYSSLVYVLWMTLSGSLHSQDMFFEPNTENGQIGQLVLPNEISDAGEFETVIDTPVGAFEMRYVTTPNKDCPRRNCPDFFEITAWPEGVAVGAVAGEIDERSTRVIPLFDYTGM